MSSPTAPSASPGCAIPISVRTARLALQPAATPDARRNAATRLPRTTVPLRNLRNALLYFETLGHLGKGRHCTAPAGFLQQPRQMVTPGLGGVAGHTQHWHAVQVCLLPQ